MQKQMLTIVQISELTGRSVTALRKAMSRKKFPYSKISGRLVVDLAEYERFLQLGQRVSAETAAGKGE